MKNTTLLALLCLALVIGAFVGLLLSIFVGQRAIAIAYDDTVDRQGWAKAEVYMQRNSYGRAVWLKVDFERHGKPSVYGKRTLGYAESQAEAINKWGRIDWRTDGLHIGSSSNSFILPRAELDH